MIEMDAMISTLQFVLRSDWVAILSGLICIADIGRDIERVISPIYDPPLIAEFVVISPARRTLSTQAQLFLECFEAEIARIQDVWAQTDPAGGLSGAAAARAPRALSYTDAGAPGCFSGCARANASFCMQASTTRLKVGNGAEIDLEEVRARRLAGEADVGDGDLVAVGVFAGRLVLQMGLQRRSARRGASAAPIS